MKPTLASFGIRRVGEDLDAVLVHISLLGRRPLAFGHHATVHHHPDQPGLVALTAPLPGILRRPPDLRPGNLLRRRTLVLADRDGACLLPGEIHLLYAALAAVPGETAP